MRDRLAEARDAGAVGMSTGLAYAPAKPAPTEEVIRLAELLGPAGGLYTTHLRDEGDEIEAALEEAFRIGRESGAAVVLSHHKVTRSEEHTSELQSLMRISYAVFCL